jgi:hypothetical protein
MPEEPLLCIKGRQNGANSNSSRISGAIIDCVKVFPERIALVCGRKEHSYDLEDIGDVFLALHPADYENIVAIYAIDDGEQVRIMLYEEEFPGLQEAIEQILKNGWGGFYEKRITSDPIMWLNALCATGAMSGVRNPYVYGFKIHNPKFRRSEGERISRSWQLKDRDDMLRVMAAQISQDAAYFIGKYTNSNMPKKKKKHIENAIKVVTLSKLVSIANEGYACDWLSYEESLAWSLAGSRALRNVCDSWGSFSQYMLDTYDIIKSPNGKAIHASYLNATKQLALLPENPRQLPWLTPLDIETGPDVNAKKLELPPGFQYMPELGSDTKTSSKRFRDAVSALAVFIEAGNCSVEDVKVRLHILISIMQTLIDKYCDDETPEEIRDSFCNTVNEIFQFYAIDFDAFEAWKIHETDEYDFF